MCGTPFLDSHMELAIGEAKRGLDEGGIPIGAVLVKNGEVLASGHNKLVQESSPILHGEMDCIQNAGRLLEGNYLGTVLYSTLMPCYMCAGAVVQFKIPIVVVGESRNYSGAMKFMKAHGVQVVDLDLPDCVRMMSNLLKKTPISGTRTLPGKI